MTPQEGRSSAHGRGPAPDGFIHEALIYGSDEDFLATAIPFLRDGVAAGEPTLVGVDEGLERLIRSELGTPPGIELLTTGHYRRPLATFRQNFELPVRHARAGAARFRVLGGVPHDPWRDWFRYEAAINELFAELPIWGICPYDARSTPDEILADVQRTHPNLTVSGRPDSRRLPYEDPAELVNRRARAEGELLDASQPDVELRDPSAAQARRALTAISGPTVLDNEDIDALCLSTGALIANARRHGRPEVRLRAWAVSDRIEVTVRDCGDGPADPFVGLLPIRRTSSLVEANSLHVIHHAVSDVALYTDDTGFTVHLTQARTV